MDDLKGFVPFFFRYLPETRPIQRSCRPNTILCQLTGHPRRRRKQQTHVTIGGAVVASKRERKSSTYSHPTVLNEKELVADAYEHFSHAALNRARVVEIFTSMLEQWKPSFVFADAESFVLC